MENPESETTSVSFVAGTSNFDVTPPASGLQQTIQNISAGFTAGGIQIDPFIMKIVKGAASDVWQNRIGTTPIAFMRINADGNFKPLGDYAIVGSPMTASRVENFASYLFSAVAGREDALMPPVSATWILDDNGSGNPANMDYWTLNPPDGYVALGIAITNSGTPPDLNNYWCVKSEYTVPLPGSCVQTYWSDKGQNWHHSNGNLDTATSIPIVDSRNMLFIPPVMLSKEAGTLPFALSVQLPTIEMTTVDTPEPHMTGFTSPSIGTASSRGWTGICVVPFFSRPGSDMSQYPENLWYFLTNEPYYELVATYYNMGSSTDTNYQISYTYGWSQTQEASFSEETSISISAEAGVELGPTSAKITASYTETLGFSSSTASTFSREQNTNISKDIPANTSIGVWAGGNFLGIYDSNGKLLNYVQGTNDNQILTNTYPE
jgi:hypothetical protein